MLLSIVNIGHSAQERSGTMYKTHGLSYCDEKTLIHDQDVMTHSESPWCTTIFFSLCNPRKWKVHNLETCLDSDFDSPDSLADSVLNAVLYE